MARIAKRCQDLPGHELFQYQDDAGETHDINSDDVNEYLRQIAGEEFTAKDFRTWAGTLLAASYLHEYKRKLNAASKKAVVNVVRSVAEQLGNTVSVCRKCYIIRR